LGLPEASALPTEDSCPQEVFEAVSSLLWSLPDLEEDWYCCLQAPSTAGVQDPPSISCLLSQETAGPSLGSLTTLPPVDLHGEIQPEPEKILDRRVRKVNNQALARS
jgi:hypothetical protein